MELLFATGNAAKLKQAQFVADSLRYAFKIVQAKQLYGELASYQEKGNTPLLVALQGALDVYKKVRLPLFVEDSVLEIDALKGYPGIFSGRELQRVGRRGILDKMRGVEDRKAKITSVVVHVDKNGKTRAFKHAVAGSIAKQEKWMPGEPIWVGPSLVPWGGGYNTLFIPRGETKTLAEFTAGEGLEKGYREKNFSSLFAFLSGKEVPAEAAEDMPLQEAAGAGHESNAGKEGNAGMSGSKEKEQGGGAEGKENKRIDELGSALLEGTEEK